MDLSRRWPIEGAGTARDALLAAYADPGRGYHDVQHLAEVLDRLDELAAAGTAFDPVTVRLAAWFHDGVYDGRPDDEERSAVWAETALGAGAGLTAAQVGEVGRLVRLTAHHRPDEADADGCALSDADLAILAAGPERYADYVATVRREYAAVPDEAFRAGRAAILRDLAAKPTLFHTAHARARWEDAARANLESELSGLSRPSSG